MNNYSRLEQCQILNEGGVAMVVSLFEQGFFVPFVDLDVMLLVSVLLLLFVQCGGVLVVEILVLVLQKMFLLQLTRYILSRCCG